MSKLNYINRRWEGTLQRADGEEIYVSLSDATLRKYLNAYLESIDLPTQTYFEMLEHVQKVQAQQYEAFQQILELEPWLTRNDPDVRIISTLWRKNARRDAPASTTLPFNSHVKNP